MRGFLIAEINKVKNASSDLWVQVESQIQQLEKQYIANPADNSNEAWQSVQSAYAYLLSSAGKKSFFLQTGIFFEEGGKTVRPLAKIVNSHQRSPAIGAMRSQASPLVHYPELMIHDLAAFLLELIPPYYIIYAPRF